MGYGELSSLRTLTVLSDGGPSPSLSKGWKTRISPRQVLTGSDRLAQVHAMDQHDELGVHHHTHHLQSRRPPSPPRRSSRDPQGLYSLGGISSPQAFAYLRVYPQVSPGLCPIFRSFSAPRPLPRSPRKGNRCPIGYGLLLKPGCCCC